MGTQCAPPTHIVPDWAVPPPACSVPTALTAKLLFNMSSSLVRLERGGIAPAAGALLPLPCLPPAVAHTALLTEKLCVCRSACQREGSL